tara:strand:- start:13 stop:336 length:324 start_codon:yes stop_codon:yes gene_type:complete
MQQRDRKIIAIVVLVIAIIQFLIVAVRYLQSCYNLSNPLIPDSLLMGIRNYSFVMMGCYLAAIVLMAIYLKTKKLFWLFLISSILILAGISLFTLQIQNYFINHLLS